jgi:hypothetical protein
MALAIQIAVAVALLGIVGAIAGGLLGKIFPDDPEGARFLRRLFLGAVFFRTAIAVGTLFFLPYGYLAPDEAGYVTSVKATPSESIPARSFPQVAIEPNPPESAPGAPSSLTRAVVAVVDSVNGRGWDYFNARLGGNRLLPRLWNCVVGSLTCIVCYALARRLGAGWSARLSAVLAAFFPSLLLWSSLNLKDADVGLLAVAGLLLGIQPQAPRLKYVAEIAAASLIGGVLLSLRVYAAAALATSLAVALVTCSGLGRWVGARAHPWLLVGAPIAGLIAMVLFRFPSVGESIFRSAGLEQLAHLRRGFAVGAASAITPNPGIGTLVGALKFLPRGLVDFLLRPYPWEPGSTVAALTRPETVIYYVLLVPAGLGILLALRRTASLALPLVTFLVVEAVGYGLVISNLGTIYRERAPALLVMFIFVGVAFEELRRLTQGEPGPSRSEVSHLSSTPVSRCAAPPLGSTHDTLR